LFIVKVLRVIERNSSKSKVKAESARKRSKRPGKVIEIMTHICGGFWPDPSTLGALLRPTDPTSRLFSTFLTTLVATKLTEVKRRLTLTRRTWRLSLLQPERPLAQNLTLRLTLRKTDF